MLPNRMTDEAGPDQYFPRTRVDTNGNNTSTALVSLFRDGCPFDFLQTDWAPQE